MRIFLLFCLLAFFISCSPKPAESGDLNRIRMDESDEVYISGNHKNLGNYQDNKIKLKKTSNLIREIELKIPSPSYLRFTGGPNKTEAIMKNVNLQELISFPIDIQTEDEYEFEIIDWKK